MFPNIKVKEVSALTNYNITEVFQQIIKELDDDPALKGPAKEYYDEVMDVVKGKTCLLYTSPSPRDKRQSRMPSSA